MAKNLQAVMEEEREEHAAQKARGQALREAEEKFGEAMKATIAKHEIEMSERTGQHQQELQHMQSQLLLLTAAMGEERTRKVRRCISK